MTNVNERIAELKRKRIGVVMGGPSAEREVSLNSGKGIHKALLGNGYQAIAIDWKPDTDLTTLLRSEKIDVVWNALHGTHGEDGCVQGLLECLKIPYTGSGVLASALAMDKILSKKVFEKEGLPTPPFTILEPGDDAEAIAKGYGYPVVVKPSREGSSVGVTIVHDPSELPAAVEVARKCHGVTMIESFVKGREVNVGVLDDRVLGTVEIRPKNEFYDYEAKYLRNDTEYLVPAPLPPDVEQKARAVALRAFQLFGCAGYARVDLIIDDLGKAWVLEINTLPGMTGTSLLPKIARYVGVDYAMLVERILLSAALHA